MPLLLKTASLTRHLLLPCALAVLPVALAAKDDSATQVLLVSATHQASLLEDSRQPFELDVDFTAMINMPRQGHLKLRWEAKDRWWSKVTLGPFEQVKMKIGEKSYTLRTGEFTPTRVDDLFDLLHVARHYDKLIVKKDKQKMEDGLTLDCIEAQRTGYIPKEICVNAATREIVSETRKYERQHDHLVRRERFSDFVDFEGYRYPRRLELLEDGKPLVTANVIDLRPAPPLDARLTTAPKGAIERRECEDEKPPSPIGDFVVRYDHFFVPKGSSNLVVVTILADGNIGGMHVLESGGAALDRAVMDSIKGTKFKPALCGSDPVEADYTFGIGDE